MKIAVGCDKFGFELKETIKSYLQGKGIEVVDHGVPSSKDDGAYYDIASEVAKSISDKKIDRGILCCGSGMGMAIIANKYPGVYAAVCENITAAERARSINDSNVLTLGGFVTSPEKAREIVDAWLNTRFTQGWEAPIAEWLQGSKGDIDRIEKASFKDRKE